MGGKVPKAKLICSTVEVLCGHCGESITHPSAGSVFWLLSEIEDGMTATCDSCGRENKITVPARVSTEA